MAEIRLPRVEKGQAKIRNVPIAVTPEGFWCCPSPVVFQKTLKAQNPLNKQPKPSSPPPPPKTGVQRRPVPVSERRASAPAPSRLLLSDDQLCHSVSERPPPPQASTSEAAERPSRSKIESMPRKVAIEFGKLTIQ